MKITQVTYRRKVNSGNFESFDIEATATILAHESAQDAAKSLQAFVDTLCTERLAAGTRGTRSGKDVGEAPQF